MDRGEIYWVDLPIPRGSKPGYRRPILIVQGRMLNRSKIPTNMVCPMTSNGPLAKIPGNVLIKSGESGLQRDSVAVACQIMTINKSDLGNKAGDIPAHLMLAIDNGTSEALELEK